MRKYVVIYQSVFIENLQYTANIAMGFITYLILTFVFINLWNYMYAAPGGFDCRLYEGADDLVRHAHRNDLVWRALVNGQGTGVGGYPRRNIAYLINKPYRYPFYILAKYTGEWNIQLPMYAALTAAAGITMVGALPDFHWLTLVAAVPCIALGMTIHAVLKLCISMLSFGLRTRILFSGCMTS